MNYDFAHLRFLFNRVQSGDRIYPDDEDFIVNLDSEIKIANEMIDSIRERLLND